MGSFHRISKFKLYLVTSKSHYKFFLIYIYYRSRLSLAAKKGKEKFERREEVREVEESDLGSGG